jgi:hypothetical protein
MVVIPDLHDAHRQGGPALRVTRLLQQPLVRYHVLRPLRVHIQRVPAQPNASDQAAQHDGRYCRSREIPPCWEAVEVGPERVLKGRRDLRGSGGGPEAAEHLVVHFEAAPLLVRPPSPSAGLGLLPLPLRRRVLHGHGYGSKTTTR